MLKKLLSFLLSFCMLAQLCSAAAFAADNTPSYFVNGSVSGSTLTLHVYVQNTRALSGRLALSYDTELLETPGAEFYDVVESVGSVSITTERHADSVLVGNGRVMFAWYISSIRGLNATESDKEIATVTLRLKDGVTADSFNSNTLGLYYVNETMVDGWDCSSEIICNVNGRMMAYRNTAVDDTYCPISFEYPNSDVVPVVSHNITVNVKNTDGVTLESTVLLGSEEKQTDAYGTADFKLQKGTYVYRARAPYYETKEGFYNVGDEDAVFNIVLRSYGQIAKDTAEALEIGYAEGDSAESVTTDLVLVTECDYGTISWESTDRNVVSPSGGVVRGYDDTEVTLIATVTVEGASHTKEFPITVKSRYTEKEKSTMIVSQDAANLEIVYAPGDDKDNVTAKLTLPETGEKGSAIVWESSNPDIISENGAVTCPMDDTEVTLTATILRGSVKDTKKFTVTVKGTGRPTPEPTEEPSFDPDEPVIPITPTPEPVTDEDEAETIAIVNRIIDALEIGYANNENAENVKSALTLPTVGAQNTAIKWTSSLPAVVTPYGAVVRQTEDSDVTLTATVTRGKISADKVFTVTVKAADEIPVNPGNGQEQEIIETNTTRRSGGGGGGGGSSGGGAVSEATPSPTPTETPEATAAPVSTEPPSQISAETKRFIDIDNVPWAQNAINTLAERGVITGTGENTYSPNNNIRRADFVMLLMKLYDLDSEITETFEDVTEGSYYYESVSKAKSLGIISGVDETHFNPDGYISRQDMMVMTYRALEKLGKSDTQTDDLSGYGDAGEISAYAKEAVEHLVGGGYIHGDTNKNLNPRLNTTRAETAVFLYNLVN